MKRNIFFTASFVLFVAIFLGFPSCHKPKEIKKQKEELTFLFGGETPSEGESLPVKPNDVHLKINPDDISLVDAGNTFNLELFRQILKKQQRGENLVLSPVSIEMALGMNLLGISDEAIAESREVIKYSKNLSPQDIVDYLGRLNNALTTAGETPCFYPMNSFWVSSKYQSHLIKEYPSLLHDFFEASVASLDLSKAESYEMINRWIDRKTYGRVQNMFNPQEALCGDPFALLVNTAFFASSWNWETTEDATKEDLFVNGNGQKEKAMMMQINDFTLIDFFENDRFSAISVGLIAGKQDAKNQQYPFQMLLLLPKVASSNLADVVPQLDELKFFGQKKQDEQLHHLQISLPRLNLKMKTLDLTNYLKDMGLVKTLGHPISHLDRMFDKELLGNPIYAHRTNKLYHNASLQWDEKSVCAAVATVIEVGNLAPNPAEIKENTIVFNRPFFAFILHSETGKILFSAAINTLK